MTTGRPPELYDDALTAAQVPALDNFPGYPRPKGATPRTALVVAYQPCNSPNSQHGAPLSSESCEPPQQASQYLTVGTADANGSLANSIGSVTLRTKLNSAPTPDDVLLASQITDVRCQASESACGAANTEPGGGPDYSGELRADASLRITDRDNGSGTQPATVTDMDFPFTLSCAQTGTNQAIGSTCGVTTSANTLVPGSVQTNKRAIWELGPVQVFDGGSSGVAGASDATLFEYQGVFAP